MSAMDDFSAEVTAFSDSLAAKLTDLSAAISAEIARVADALSHSNDPAVVAATAQLTAAQATMEAGLQAAVDSLNNELPTPPPAP